MTDRILELKEQHSKLLTDAQEILAKEGVTPEEKLPAYKMVENAKAITKDIETLMQIKEVGAAMVSQVTGAQKPEPQTGGFKTLGEFLREIHQVKYQGRPNLRLKSFKDTNEPSEPTTGENGWPETKQMVENVGASGGFLVPTQAGTSLLQWSDVGDNMVVESGATKIPMQRRSITFPVLHQTATTAGVPHWWGGVLASWTEEAGYKDMNNPTFDQIELVAHKLVCYSEASDELLEDSIVSLEAILRAAFSGATSWERQWAFINGTGAGQPLGIIGAPATIAIAPVAVGALAVADFTNMLMSFQGSNPIWMMSRRWMSQLLQLNGPVGSPEYVFIPNAREGAPATLFGFPVYYVEQMPLPGADGSVLLVDRSKYLIGDRTGITIDSTKAYRFRYDLTSWRCVSRVDGQPWLRAPLTYSDGVTQVSPFVKLGAIAAT
jgi:HK97 family phage major capsid protein